MKTLTMEEYVKLMMEQEVPKEDVTFRCPRCGTLQSANDLIAAGAGKTFKDVEGYLGFSCIGRFDKNRGCDWTLGGLFSIHEIEVIKDGKKHPRFMPVKRETEFDKNKAYVVAVIGSRTFTNYNYVANILKTINISKIISGGAKGVDSIAALYAKKHGIPFVEIKPEYKKYGKRAPMIRNEEIVLKAESIIAFWDGKSRGTKFTIDRAKRTGKLCVVYAVKIV